MLAVHETSYQQSLRSLKKKISTLHNSTMAVFKIGKKINGKSGRSFWCSVPVAGHGLWRSCRGGWHTGAPSVPGVCSRWPQGLSWCITFLRSSRWIKIISDKCFALQHPAPNRIPPLTAADWAGYLASDTRSTSCASPAMSWLVLGPECVWSLWSGAVSSPCADVSLRRSITVLLQSFVLLFF